jgi:site-specific DNA-methyltransferase (adenine-specific)
MIDLRLGRWEDALADVERVDAVICDPPYSDRTHAGHDAVEGLAGHRRGLGYFAWTPADVRGFVSAWSPRCAGWLVAMTDHTLFGAWERALLAAGRYVFAPVPSVSPGARVRLSGDGPSCWTDWIVVARPRRREFCSWGTLRGHYLHPPERDKVVAGGKPLSLMRALVRDYTRPNDLVCDPCAGGGTTLLAAAMEGRRAIGAEMDPATHAKAQARIAAGYTPDMFSGVPELEIKGEQGDLL